MRALPLEIGKLHDFNNTYVTYVDNKVVKAALKEQDKHFLPLSV
jgi:hypothetical protein